LKPNVVSELVSSTSADIRQILNLLSTYRLSKRTMTFDQSKDLYDYCFIIIGQNWLKRISQLDRLMSCQSYLVSRLLEVCHYTKKLTATFKIIQSFL
jgi:hypothetical protein